MSLVPVQSSGGSLVPAGGSGSGALIQVNNLPVGYFFGGSTVDECNGIYELCPAGDHTALRYLNKETGAIVQWQDDVGRRGMLGSSAGWQLCLQDGDCSTSIHSVTLITLCPFQSRVTLTLWFFCRRTALMVDTNNGLLQGRQSLTKSVGCPTAKLFCHMAGLTLQLTRAWITSLGVLALAGNTKIHQMKW